MEEVIKNFKTCYSFDDFICLMDDLKQGISNIYLFDKKIDKRRNFDDWEDIFDNMSLNYYIKDNNIYFYR